MKRRKLYVLLLTLYSIVLVGFFINWGTYDLVIQRVFYLFGPITAIIFGLKTLQNLGHQGKRARVLRYMLIALGLWLGGEILTLSMTWQGISPYPSLSDALFILGYIAFSMGVFLEAKLYSLNYKTLNRSTIIFISSLFAVIVGIVGYFSVIGYKPEENWLVNLTTLSWSIGDVVMGGLGLLLLVMVRQYKSGIANKAWLWFMAATLVNCFTDIAYNLSPQVVFEGSILTIIFDALWVGAYFLFAGYFAEIYLDIQWLKSKMVPIKTN